MDLLLNLHTKKPQKIQLIGTPAFFAPSPPLFFRAIWLAQDSQHVETFYSGQRAGNGRDWGREELFHSYLEI